jgi:hypothetical protein
MRPYTALPFTGSFRKSYMRCTMFRLGTATEQGALQQLSRITKQVWREGRTMAHWQYILWGLGGPTGFAAACRYVPRAFLMLMGGLTANPQRSKQCAEMVRLSRKDAKELPSYLVESSGCQSSDHDTDQGRELLGDT